MNLTASFFIFIFSFPNALPNAAHVRQCTFFMGKLFSIKCRAGACPRRKVIINQQEYCRKQVAYPAKEREKIMCIKNLQSTLENGRGYLISSPENRRYLTGFASSDGYLLITKTEAVFLIDSRYIEAVGTSLLNAISTVLMFKSR